MDTKRTFSVAVWNGKNAGRNDNLLHEEKARACVVFSLKRSLKFLQISELCRAFW